MAYAQGFARQNCSLLAVLSGQLRPQQESKCQSEYPPPELLSWGRLEVQTLVDPTFERFAEVQRSSHPNVLYFQGERIESEDQFGSLVWENANVSDPEMLSSLLSPPFPTIVYLEIPYGEKIAEAFSTKGVPYVIYWKNELSFYAASHFRQALLYVVQSSCSHTWDAFQLALASFRMYCMRNNQVSQNSKQNSSANLGPHILGDAPKIKIPQPVEDIDQDDEGSTDVLPSLTIFDEDVNMRFLVCGLPCILDANFLEALEEGLNALLNIEIRGSKLQNRVSAAPPPLQAGSLSRGVVTMRCDITTCSFAHISLLVSGSAQTCFDDQLLESHIKSEIVEKIELVHALPSSDENKSSSLDPLNSISIACGASVFEVHMKVPTWAAQVLKHLAPEVSYRSLVTLGITSVQGIPVASFEKEDADRLLFFCRMGTDCVNENTDFSYPPRWYSSLSTQGCEPNLDSGLVNHSITSGENGAYSCSAGYNMNRGRRSVGASSSRSSSGQKSNISVMRPIPHSRKHKLLPFMGTLADANEASQPRTIMSAVSTVKHLPPAPTTHRKSSSSSFRAQQIVHVNPLPMKKHGCDRSPIQVCSEEEFLKDVMQFLIVRGHSRLVNQGGLAEFPDVILNAKRLDLYNLYREVVSRGGFYVGNGINWKGQVFPKMRNHTATNKMTGVGNTLKRHYETYLLEYELAHDDVDGECCLLCQSSAPGDWVNCGLCGEWAHFGCDRRPGLGTFKDYAKTDGLEYICPRCSITNCKKKSQKMFTSFSNTSTASRL